MKNSIVTIEIITVQMALLKTGSPKLQIKLIIYKSHTTGVWLKIERSKNGVSE